MHPHCMVGRALWTHRLQHMAASAVGHDCHVGMFKASLMAGKATAIHLGFRVQSVSHSLVGMLLRFPLCWDAWVCWPPSQTSLKGRDSRACSALALRWFPGPLAVLPVRVHGVAALLKPSACIRSGGGSSCRAQVPRWHQRLHGPQPRPCPPGLPPLPGAQTAAMGTCTQRNRFELYAAIA